MNWTDNYFTVFICTFQMPFFILISGYFFSKDIEHKTAFTVAKEKLKGVLIPILIWNTIFYIPISMLSLWQGWQSSDEIIHGFIPYLFEGLWYLWAYLLISLLMCIVCCFAKKESVRLFGYIGILIITHAGLGGFCHLDFMFPFFLLGYCIEKIEKKLSARMKTSIVLALALVFPVMVYLFRPEYSMYILGRAFDLSMGLIYIKAYAIRFLAGVTGSAFVGAVLYFLWHKVRRLTIVDYMLELGRWTMALYILHTLLISYFMRWLIDGMGIHAFFETYIHLTNFVISPIIVVVTFEVCKWIINLIKKTVLSNFIFGIKKHSLKKGMYQKFK